MAWGYERGFVIEHDNTLKRRIDCKSCLYYEPEDKSCMKRPLYLPEDGYNSWKNCAYFKIDPSTSNFEEKEASYKAYMKKHGLSTQFQSESASRAESKNFNVKTEKKTDSLQELKCPFKGIKKMPISDIIVLADKRIPDENSIKDAIAFYKAHNCLESPVLVVCHKDKYQLAGGKPQYYAAQRLGLKIIDVAMYAEIKKGLCTVGRPVTHNRYGLGVICKNENGIVSITFKEDNTREFVLDDCLNHGVLRIEKWRVRNNKIGKPYFGEGGIKIVLDEIEQKIVSEARNIDDVLAIIREYKNQISNLQKSMTL